MAKSKINDSEEILPTLADDLFDEEDEHELVSIFIVEEREGSLSQSEIQKFKRHLSLCETCSEKYSVLAGLLGMLETDGKKPQPVVAEGGPKVAAQGNGG